MQEVAKLQALSLSRLTGLWPKSNFIQLTDPKEILEEEKRFFKQIYT